MNHSNTTLTDQDHRWLNEVAGRLRLIQADTSQVGAGERGEFLQEEIERSLKSVPSANRKPYLEALLARFPVAGMVVRSVSAAPTATVPVRIAESPEETLERFLKSVAELSEPQRAAAIRRLVEAQLVPQPQSAPVVEISEEMQRVLGLPPGQPPRLDRLAQFAALLLEVLYRLDKTALKTVEVMAPRSSLLKRSESFREATARFLTGETESLEPQLRVMSGLLGALLTAMLSGGRDFGRQHVERFSPSAIEDVVTGEGSSGIFGRSKKERCWDKYSDLARDYATSDLVDRRIKDCFAAVVQRTFEKSGLSGS
ncbi:MAG: hypothetical protein IH623_11495 [Verrucomicrobia bacterium]|nr:hypothetical protein [Verrucomicrobiota bacterium]